MIITARSSSTKSRWLWSLASCAEQRISLPVGPPLVHRVLRCNDSDQAELVTALAALINLIEPPPMGDMAQYAGGNSMALGLNVTFFDIWPRQVDLAEVQAAHEGLLFAELEEAYFQLAPLWPDHPEHVRDDQLGPAQVPVLVLHGAVDQATPNEWRDRAASALAVAPERVVTFPTYGHATIFWGLDASQNCPVQILTEFLADPAAQLDKSCIEPFAAIDFAGSQPSTAMLSLGLFGTSDLWGAE